MLAHQVRAYHYFYLFRDFFLSRCDINWFIVRDRAWILYAIVLLQCCNVLLLFNGHNKNMPLIRKRVNANNNNEPRSELKSSNVALRESFDFDVKCEEGRQGGSIESYMKIVRHSSARAISQTETT